MHKMFEENNFKGTSGYDEFGFRGRRSEFFGSMLYRKRYTII